MTPSFVQLFPLLYGACFLILLWQAFRVMAQGFKAVPRPGDQPGHTRGDRSPERISAQHGEAAGSATNPKGLTPDRTGRLTIHPELLDSDGQLTREDLLTVRFSGDSEESVLPPDSP